MFSNGRNSRLVHRACSRPTTSTPDRAPGNFPTDPMLVNGPVVNHAPIDALFPPGTRPAQHRHRALRQSRSKDRLVAAVQPRLRAAAWRQSRRRASTSSDPSSATQYILMDLNPALGRRALATGAVTRTNPLVGAPGEFVGARRYASPTTGTSTTTPSRCRARSVRATAGRRGCRTRIRAATATRRPDRPISSNSQFLDDLRLDNEIGPTNVDRPHILSIDGVVRRAAYRRTQAERRVTAPAAGRRSRSIDTTFDADRNGITTNEYLPAGTYSGTGEDAITVDYDGGRNGGTRAELSEHRYARRLSHPHAAAVARSMRSSTSST